MPFYSPPIKHPSADTVIPPTSGGSGMPTSGKNFRYNASSQELQIKNVDTGKYHEIAIGGTPGAEYSRIEEGES